MAGIKETKTEVKNADLIKRIKLGDSFVSLILGAAVVVIVVVLIFSFGKNRKIQDTSSIQDGPIVKKEKKADKDATLGEKKIYTVKPGDDLWHIAEKLYKDGYKWIEIAKINNLKNPNIIFSQDKLLLPDLKPALDLKSKEQDVLKTNLIEEKTYTVISGDDLWQIAVRAYADGFKWVDIAKVNNLENPDLIFPGDILKIPRFPSRW